MTIIQKRQVAYLREKGESYATIAATIGASENTVKGFLIPRICPLYRTLSPKSTVYHCAVYSSIRTCYVGKTEPICHDGRWALWAER